MKGVWEQGWLQKKGGVSFLLLLIHQQVEVHVEKTLKNTWTKFHILHPQKKTTHQKDEPPN